MIVISKLLKIYYTRYKWPTNVCQNSFWMFEFHSHMIETKKVTQVYGLKGPPPTVILKY